MQAKVYEFFKFGGQCDILVVEDDKEAFLAKNAAIFASKECYTLPDFRACEGDDLRAFNGELLDISKNLSNYYKSLSKNKLLIIPIRTILNKLPSSKNLAIKSISYGEKIDIDKLKNELVGFGYNFVDIVQTRGEVRVGGEVIDIFSVNSEKPVRILLNIDIVESIRNFDLITQKSNQNEIYDIEISPFLATLNENEQKDVQDKISHINENALISDLNSFGFWVIDGFIDYFLHFNCILSQKFILDEDLPNKDLSFLDKLKILPEPRIYKDTNFSINADLVNFHKDKCIIVLSANESSFNALNLSSFSNIKLQISSLILNIISKNELIVSLNSQVKKSRIKKANIIIDELKAGDFVVHSEYGIGKFIGLELLNVLGSKKEFVVINYENDDRLLLPAVHLNMIDRYIASSGSAVSLDRLGKASFSRIKEKIREKLFAIANKIISMAAKRELVNGIKFNDSNEILKFRLEAGFEYTADQQKAILDIENDLKSGKAMDRLLSGDVGFGKTEVAMNAIFMCVKSGYQALFFVPTTLLASQHYKSLVDRLSKFNIKIFRCDRFINAKQKSILKAALSNGEPLVAIGTHGLLSLKAPKLGLVIIDEEHKFGVKQKEKLKEISENSHILSMSATPIPRSLNMALSKVKSYSTLTIAPLDRLDVRTFVKQWEEKLIKEVIARELRRKGQIFYIHNLISDLVVVENELKSLMPNLKILTLHGKVNSDVVENEMVKFANTQYDLLLCTSIVESGIHLPNVNTIIVDEANKFGMADLHQLRGRVGRGKEQGYCYFLIKDKNNLSKEAISRLVALENNSFLGSGSVLAYHDLEIRGGGNLIGEAQSGHIKAIGYSLYLKMLEDEINFILNKKVDENREVDLKLSVNAFLNSDLINEDRIRLELYRRLSRCNSTNEVFDIGAEIEDRFGRLDIYTNQFLELIIITILASKSRFKSISNYEQNISLTKIDNTKIILKSKSKDDDDILDTILTYLRSFNAS